MLSLWLELYDETLFRMATYSRVKLGHFKFSCCSKEQSSLIKNLAKVFSSCRRRVFSLSHWIQEKLSPSFERTHIWTRRWLGSTSATERIWKFWRHLWSRVYFIIATHSVTSEFSWNVHCVACYGCMRMIGSASTLWYIHLYCCNCNVIF